MQRMRDLSIDSNLLDWKHLFLTERSVEHVIIGLTNPIEKVKSRISQILLVFPILFLIYINKIFFIIEEQMSHITYRLIINYSNFLAIEQIHDKKIKDKMKKICKN